MMKVFLPVALLFLLAVVSCKKVDQQLEKSHAWSQKKSHNVKKYNEEKFHHHDKHLKTHFHKNPIKDERHPSEGKHHKAHHGYHEVPKHEAELQKDIKATKKEIEGRLAKEEQDLHLQDLTHPSDPANVGHKNLKNPHEHQSGHSKANHHSSHSAGQKTHHHKVQGEKLVFPELKESESKQSHPVLEDSFEAVGEETVPEQPEHSHSKKKDSTKNKKSHKKAYEKVKEKTKYEKSKTKDDKKDKKQKYKSKK